MKMLLEALGKYDFIKVESLEDIIQRIMKTTAKEASLSDSEIENIVMEICYGETTPDTGK